MRFAAGVVVGVALTFTAIAAVIWRTLAARDPYH